MSPTFAHDTNLRFPLDDPVWVEFFARHELEPAGYDDMAKLGEDLREAVAAVAFLPAGNYLYLRDEPYTPVAGALGAPGGDAEPSSLLVVPAASEATGIGKLRGSRLAYTHEFCTTSYFATALLLHEPGESIGDLFEMVPGYAFEAQLDALLDGTAEATMVQKSVLRANPDAAASWSRTSAPPAPRRCLPRNPGPAA